MVLNKVSIWFINITCRKSLTKF